MDLSSRSSSSLKTAEERRRRINFALGLGTNRLIAGKQVHGSHVEVVGRPCSSQSGHCYIPDTDALVTDLPGVTLFSLHADCASILLYDPGGAIGLAHAGWKGTVAGIAGRTVQAMSDAFGTRPETLVAAIGPTIGPECYEVGEDVRQLALSHAQVPDSVFRPAGRGRWYFDLWEANRLSLVAAGVPAGSIEISGVCTHCQVEEFFSHRAERGMAGRFGVFVALVPGT